MSTSQTRSELGISTFFVFPVIRVENEVVDDVTLRLFNIYDLSNLVAIYVH